MCGRYQSSAPTSALVERYAADVTHDGAAAEPKWNVAPTDVVRVVRQSPKEQRRVEAARWGLHRSGGGAPRLLINVRAETLLARPGLGWSRVVVPADGFYEWKPPGSEPFHFRRADGDLLSLAGLWSHGPDGARVAIVTTAAGHDMAGVHDRMPVVLEDGGWQQWLEAGGGEPLSELLGPSPAGTLAGHRVSTLVNRVSNDGPGLLDPPEEDAFTQPMLDGFA